MARKAIAGERRTRSVVDWDALSFNHRESYSGDDVLIPEIHVIGEVHSSRAITGLMIGDCHPGFCEVHLIVRGEQRFWIGSREREFTVSGGMAIITHPGEMHGGVSEVLDPVRYCWIQFAPPAVEDASAEAQPAAELARHLSQLDPPVFRCSPTTEQCFRRLLAEHQRPGKHAVEMARSLLNELMVCLVRDHDASAVAARPQAESHSVREAVRWMQQHCADRVSIEEVCEVIGSSSSHFRRLFHREMGCSPADYLTKLRIAKAMEWLREGKLSVTEIAMRLGFSSSAYFTSVFRKRCGITPSEFQRQNARIDPVGGER